MLTLLDIIKASLHSNSVAGRFCAFLILDQLPHIECRNVFTHVLWPLSLEKQSTVLQTALLVISDCYPSAPLGSLPKALLCIWCTACGSLLWDPGLYIRLLGALCVQSFHSTSERFPQYKALLFSSSSVTAKTTVWFLDGTEYAGGWLTLSSRLGERSY